VRLRSLACLSIIIAACLISPPHVNAETATIEVLHLPLQEASNAAKSQLSRQGTVAQLPSRRILIIQDDAGHIERARALIKRLDMPAPQLNVQVGVTEEEESGRTALAVSGIALPGGWVRIQTSHKTRRVNNSQRFRVSVASGKYGHIETGYIRAVRPSVRHFMHRYGIVDTPDLALIPITAGFDVEARLIGKNNVLLHIHPWFERGRQNTDIQAKIEILPDLGSTDNTRKPPDTHAPMRLNIQPRRPNHIEHIAITEADTELTVKLGETVTLAAARQTAKDFGNALLAHHATVANRSILLRLTVTHTDY